MFKFMIRAAVAIFVVISVISVTTQASTLGSFGAGLETRMQREVNPSYSEMKSLGQLFLQFDFGRWVLHSEVGEEEQDSQVGMLSVSSRTLNGGLWGRFQFRDEGLWIPYLGSGVGTYYDRVISEFGSARDERSGYRLYWGAGAGLSAVFAKLIFTEAELRGSLVRDRKDPLISAMLRVGVAFY